MPIPVIILSITGLFFGIVLSIGSKVLAVKIDKRIQKVEGLLPGVNCGACGYAGCSAFAVGVVNGDVSASSCLPGGADVAHNIASFLGVDAGEVEEMTAAVHCIGGIKETSERAIYDGIKSCKAAELVSNGSKSCQYGCHGLNDCVVVCEFDAIHINANGIAEVDYEKCTACGACVPECPRKLIDIIPKSQKIFLGCSNHDRGGKVKKNCSVACTACTLCVKAVTHPGAMKMEDNLPVLAYDKGENFIASSYKCPSNCFVDNVPKRPVANIDTKCTGCGDCVPVCPVRNTITGEPGERFSIDKDLCIGCGICNTVCEPGAITLWGSLGHDRTTKKVRIGEIS